jgi:hypothetical protein
VQKDSVTTDNHARKSSVDDIHYQMNHLKDVKIALDDIVKTLNTEEPPTLASLLPDSRSAVIPFNSSLKPLLVARLSISTTLLGRTTRALANNVVLVDGVLLVAL